MKNTLLLLDDDESTRTYIQKAFSADFQIHAHPIAGNDPLELIRQKQPSCILVDSFEVCKMIKADESFSLIPVIILSSKNKPSDISVGLSMGADDFITKPFDRKELGQRIQSVFKNVKNIQKARTIVVGPLEIDTLDRNAKFKGILMNLTITEFDILRLLASKPGVVISREEIMKTIWKDSAEETTDRTIDVHIRSLRKKTPELAAHIKSVYGVGYQYVE